MSKFEDEVEAITRGAGLADRADQEWIALVGDNVLQAVEHWTAGAPAGLSPGSGLCGVRFEAIGDETVDLRKGVKPEWH